MNTIPTTLTAVPDIAGPIPHSTEDGKLYSISEMAEMFDVTLRTLRFYEEKGLLNPVRRGSRRFYREQEVGRMRVILQAKRIGLTLVEIRQVLKLVEGKASRAEQLKNLRSILRVSARPARRAERDGQAAACGNPADRERSRRSRLHRDSLKAVPT